MKNIKSQFTKENYIAFVGLCLVQLALVPSHLSGEFPALSLPCLIFAGLLCYLYKAIIDNDIIYMMSNSIGLALNGLMIIRIWMAS